MVDIIFPVHNIEKRGYNRVLYSLMSLANQKDRIGKVLIPDSSEEKQYRSLHAIASRFDFVEHFPVENYCFNKPKLYREALKRSNSDYIFFTDCDYVFSPKLLEQAENYRDDNKIIFKLVFNLPNQNMGPEKIKKWKFMGRKPHEWGQIANGAMQYSTREFFEMAINNVPEYLDMEGWGAMDNMMAYIAHKHGLDIHWLAEEEILHQFHRVMKYRDSMDKKRFDNNQAIMQGYRAKYNLPELLDKNAKPTQWYS